MFGLCKYKNALGRPGKGIHSFRIANIAVVDVLLTFVLAYVLWVLLEKYNYWVILYCCFLAAVVLHRMFCVKTPVDKFLFS